MGQITNPLQVVGTANEVAVASSGSTRTLSLPSALTFAGKTITGGTYTGVVQMTIGSVPGTPPTEPSVIYWTSGNVGLRLIADGGTIPAQMQLTGYGSGESNGLMIRHATGSYTTPTALASGNRVGSVFWQGYNGTAFATVSSIDCFIGTGTISSTSTPSYVTIQTTPDGSVTRLERLRIDQNGNVAIGGGDATSKLKVVSGGFNLAAYTVATLPASPVTGDEVRVTDALGPVVGAAVVGGGAVNVLVGRGPTQWNVVAILT